MKKNRSMSIFAVATALLFVVTGNANAVLTNVNFNGFTGGNLQSEVESALSGPAGGLNTRWNQYADEDSTGVMVDSTGAATSITFTTNFTEGRTGNVNNLPIYRSTLTDFTRAPQTRNLTINGLVDGSLYDVWIVAYRDASTSPTERLSGTWSTTNATTSPSAQLLDSTLIQSDNAFTEGVTFLKFANVEANGAGQIVFNAQSSLNPFATTTDIANGNTHHRLGLSGFQIQSVAPAVPEPATASLGLLALGGLMLRRRRAA